MAEEYAKLPASPNFQPVTPNDKSKAADAYAEVFGMAAKTAATKVIAMRKEQDDIKLLTAQNEIYDQAKKAEAAIYAHPDMASNISETAHQVAKSAMSGFSGMQAAKLQKVYNEHLGQVGVQAARVGAEQNKRRLQEQFYSVFPKLLEDAKSEINPEIIKDKIEQAQKLNDDMYRAQAITPREHAVNNLQFHHLLSRHVDIMQKAKEGGVSAAEYNAVTGMSFTNTTGDISQNPADQNTTHLMETHDEQHDYASAQISAQQGKFPDIQTLTKLPEHEYASVMLQYQGANDARGLVVSNNSHAAVMSRLTQLKDDGKLTEREKGEKSYLENYQKEMLHDFRAVQDKTVLGARIKNNMAQFDAMVNDTYPPGAERDRALNQNLNADIAQRDSLRRSQDQLANEVDIAPPELKQVVKDSLQPNAPIEQGINAIYKVNKANQYWLTKGLNPIQQAAVYNVSLNRNAAANSAAPTNEMADLMRAAQRSGIGEVLKGVDELKQNKVISYLTSNLTDVLNHTAKVPEGSAKTGTQWNDGLIKLGANYVYNKMEQNADYSGAKYEEYADDFIKTINKGYMITNGINFSINTNEIPISRQDGDKVTYYMLHRIREDIISRRGELEATRLMNLYPLSVTNTRDGEIIVIDRDGNRLAGEHYDTHLLALAHRAFNTKTELTEEERHHEKRILDQQIRTLVLR